LPQLGAEKMGIGVPRFARQDFVADDHDASSFRHARSALEVKRWGSEIKLAAAHKKVTIRVRTNILAFLIDELRAANRTIIPPVLFGNRLP